MRYLIVFLACQITFQVTFLASCTFNTSKKESIHETSITGKILTPVDHLLEFHLNDSTFIVDLDSANNFNLTLDISKPTYAIFSHGHEFGELYIKPGDQVRFTLNPYRFMESLTYEGDSEAINQYLRAKGFLTDSLPSHRDLMTMKESTFVMVANSMRARKLRLLLEWKNKIADSTFVMTEQAKITYDRANLFLTYPESHKYLTRKESFKVSDSFFDYEQEVDLNNTQLIGIHEFENYVFNYTAAKARQELQQEGLEATSEALLKKLPVKIHLLMSDSKIKGLLLERTFESFLPAVPIELAEKSLAAHKVFISKRKADFFETQLSQFKKIAPGAAAPSFDYPSFSGDTISNDDLLGNVIYLMLWATWCMDPEPCDEEFGHLEALSKDEMLTAKVKFVCVSLDEDQKHWSKFLNELQPPGLHLLATDSWGSPLRKDFMVENLPHFILLDPKGKIVSSDVNPPSDGAKEEILHLLEN